MADLYYIESGYFTPEAGYYVYTADGAAAVDTTLSVACDAEMIAGGVIVEATGSFNTEDTVSVDVSKIAGFVIALNSSFTQSATISHIHGSDLFAFSEAAISAQVDRIRDNNIAATVVFDIATDVGRIQQSESDADAIFSAIINGLRSRDVNLETQAAFSFAANNDKIVSTSATLQSEFTNTTSAGIVFEILSDIASSTTLTSSAGVVFDASSAITAQTDISITTSNVVVINISGNSTATLSVNVVVIKQFSSNIESQNSLTALIDATRSASSTLQSEFTQAADPQYLKDNELAGNLYVVSTFTATANTTREINTTLFDNASLTALVGVIKQNPGSITSAFAQDSIVKKTTDAISNVLIEASVEARVNKTTDIDLVAFSDAAVTTDADIIRDVSSNLSSSVSVEANNSRTRNTSAYTESIASELVVILRQRPLGAVVNVVSTLNASATVSYSGFANTNAQAILQSNPVKRVSANIAISGAMQFTAGIRDLRLDEIEYRIPAEDWLYTIYPETRQLGVVGETRQRKITQETALRTIASETRLYTVD